MPCSLSFSFPQLAKQKDCQIGQTYPASQTKGWSYSQIAKEKDGQIGQTCGEMGAGDEAHISLIDMPSLQDASPFWRLHYFSAS